MAFDLEPLVRDNIKMLVPYSSARDEYEGDARILLDANENAFGSPVGDGYNRYPDPQQKEIKRHLAQTNSIAASQIFVGNGSDEAIDLVLRIFCRPGVDNVLICPPTYGMYEVSAAINDVAVKRADLTRAFQLDTEAIFAAVDENTKVIFICSPNNPTGNLLAREAVLEVLERFQGIVVIDEAYIHFSGENSWIAKLGQFPNLVVLQTFSKAWGLAGLRVGVAFASEEIVSLLNKVKPPYNVGSAAQELVLDALLDRDSVQQAIDKIVRERVMIASALPRFRYVEQVFPSEANFLLVKVNKPLELYRFLISEDIVVRDRSAVALCEGCLRISVGTPEENGALLRALEKYETSTIY